MAAPRDTPAGRHPNAYRRIREAWLAGRREYWITYGASIRRVEAIDMATDGWLRLASGEWVPVQQLATTLIAARRQFSKPKKTKGVDNDRASNQPQASAARGQARASRLQV